MNENMKLIQYFISRKITKSWLTRKIRGFYIENTVLFQINSQNKPFFSFGLMNIFWNVSF